MTRPYEPMIRTSLDSTTPDMWAVWCEPEQDWSYPLGHGFDAARKLADDFNEAYAKRETDT